MLFIFFRLIFCVPLKKNSMHKNSIFHKLKEKNQTLAKNSALRHFLIKEYGKMKTFPSIFSQMILKMIIFFDKNSGQHSKLKNFPKTLAKNSFSGIFKIGGLPIRAQKISLIHVPDNCRCHCQINLIQIEIPLCVV